MVKEITAELVLVKRDTGGDGGGLGAIAGGLGGGLGGLGEGPGGRNGAGGPGGGSSPEQPQECGPMSLQ